MTSYTSEYSSEYFPPAPAVDDPVLQLGGAYQSERPLIDGIPVSEDPDLYLLAEMMEDEALDLHAWEIASQRYRRGKDGQPVRIAEDEN